MAKPKHLIIVSDLHLGRGFEQDDFREPGEQLVWRDAAWEFFCRSIKKWVGNEPALVILNGDIIDLWEIAHESELEGPGSATAIGARLFYPADTPQKEQSATEVGVWQVEEACDHHTGFVKGLRTLLSAPRISVRYHYGNHDHAMLNTGLQQAFRDALGPDAQGDDKLSFGFEYRLPELKAYVEHGNQFAGEDSYFEDVEDWRVEAPGYYMLRYVWNRFQHRYSVSKPTFREQVSFMLAILRRSARSQQQVETFQFLIDYFLACESGIVPRAQRLREFPFDLVYGIWKDEGKPATAEKFFRKRVQGELAEPEMPGDRFDRRLDDNRYTQGLMSRFFEKTAPFPKLQFTKDINLSIGHTHKPGEQELWGEDLRRQIYMNSGTWTRDLRHPTYVAISKANGTPAMSLFEVKR
ncbi:MAG: hypothetical protein ACT443_00910 [Gemmatimonadota bacterium]